MIYYVSASGATESSVAGSDLNGITHLPSGADYAIYVDDSVVNELNPTNQPGTYSFTDVVTGDKHTVPTATGTLTFTVQPLADQVANAQAVKEAELESALIATIEGGFNSDAVTSGTMLTYGFADSDQTNMSQELNIINAGSAVEPIEWGIKDGTVVNHTAAQFKTVCATGNQFKWAQVKQFRTLLAQVKAATTVDAVNAITWTPANY